MHLVSAFFFFFFSLCPFIWKTHTHNFNLHGMSLITSETGHFSVCLFFYLYFFLCVYALPVHAICPNCKKGGFFSYDV